jgi:hypothetical protein
MSHGNYAMKLFLNLIFAITAKIKSRRMRWKGNGRGGGEFTLKYVGDLKG